MLGSNQRSLPCEVKAIMPLVFVVVKKSLQNCVFVSGNIRVCSPPSAWVGVLLV